MIHSSHLKKYHCIFEPKHLGGFTRRRLESTGTGWDALGTYASGGHESPDFPAVAFRTIGYFSIRRKMQFFKAVVTAAALIFINRHFYLQREIGP